MRPLVLLHHVTTRRAAAVFDDVELRRPPRKLSRPPGQRQRRHDDERGCVASAEIGVLRGQHADGGRASSRFQRHVAYAYAAAAPAAAERAEHPERGVRQGVKHHDALAVHPRREEPSHRRIGGRRGGTVATLAGFTAAVRAVVTSGEGACIRPVHLRLDI